jgi:hypothetical protein
MAAQGPFLLLAGAAYSCRDLFSFDLVNQATNPPLTLLVLAAGWGQRYGGLKQLARVGPGGEFLLDYAIFDALRAGFERVVFVLRDELVGDFEQLFMRSLRQHVQVDHVVQRLDDLPPGHGVPSGRTKPWGTLHAIWSARHAVRHPFAVINADDFYGAQSFQAIADFLRSPPLCAKGLIQGCMAGFALSRTLSEHGGVNRGICEVDRGVMRSVAEYTRIAHDANGSLTGLNPGGACEVLDSDACVSMNLWAWSSDIFPSVSEYLSDFFVSRSGEPQAEAYAPSWWDQVLRSRKGVCSVLPSNARWAGLTYAGDLPGVRAYLQALVAQGEYPLELWK